MSDLSKKAEIPGDDGGMSPHEESPIIRDERYIGEMATIASDTRRGLNIFVNPDPNRIGVPCFKVCNSAIRQEGNSKIACLHFKDSGMAFHTGDGFSDWELNTQDIEKIKEALLDHDEDLPQYTIWQMACYKWNLEYFQGAIGSAAKYFQGEYDEELKDNPAYVPSIQPMPEGWVYNPPDVDPLHENSEEQSASGEPFFEMAGRIPEGIRVDANGKHTLIVAVGADENTRIAHFHVYRSQDDLNAWSNGACLMFTEGRYFSHEKNYETLNHDELDAVIAKLKEPPRENLPGKTNWEYLIFLWNAGNYDTRIPLTTSMPAYNYNTITRYTERVLVCEPQLKAKGAETPSCPVCLETTITPREALRMMDAGISTETDESSDWLND